MSNETDRKSDFEEAHKDAHAGWSNFQMCAEADLRAYLKDTWTNKDRLMLLAQDREPMTFPKIRKNVKLVTGYQRKNRMSIKFDPVENTDDETATQMTAMGLHVMKKAKAYAVISDAFEGALLTGINLVNLYNDRNWNTHFDRFYYNQFLLDPNFRYRDLRDCAYGMMRKYITREDAKMLLPGKEGFINGLPDGAGTDDKFPNYKQPTLYGQKLLPYDEWQRRETKRVKMVVNRQDGMEVEWKGTKEQLEGLLSEYPELDTVTKYIPTIEVTCYLAGIEVKNGIDPFEIGDFSYTPVMAYWHPEGEHMDEKLQSFVHSQVDSQRASDKRIMAMISLFEQQIGAGLDFEEDALIDEDDAWASGNKPRQFAKGALAENRARDRQVPDIPQGMFQLHNLFSEEMTKSVNINEELLGQPGGNPQIAGVLAQFRAGQALVGLQDLFDNLNEAQCCMGKKLIKLMQQYPPSKVMRILGTQPTKSFYEKQLAEYDAEAVEGIMTSSQRNMFYSEMVQLKEVGAKIGDPAPIPWSLIFKFAPVQMRGELQQSLQQQEQMQQQQMQRQNQLQDTLQQLAIMQAQNELQEGQATAIERRSAAMENISDAQFNRAKTAAEIEGLRDKSAIEILKISADLEKARLAAESKPAPQQGGMSGQA